MKSANGTSVRSGGDLTRDKRRIDFGDFIRKYGTVLVLAFIFLGFSIIMPDKYLSITNINNILRQGSILSILAISLTVNLIAKNFDMSIAAVAGVGAALIARLMSDLGISVPAAVCIGLVAGILLGLINALLVCAIGLPSLVGTLATGSMFQAFELLACRGKTIFVGIPASFTNIGQGDVLGVSFLVLYMLVWAFVIWFIVTQTVPGRRITAIGGNLEASRLAGINVRTYRALAFLMAALGATLAGILTVARSAVYTPQTTQGLLLPSFAAVFIGASTFKEGQFNIPGTLIGVFIMQTAMVGLAMLNVPFWFNYLFQGVVLGAAVALGGISGLKSAF